MRSHQALVSRSSFVFETVGLNPKCDTRNKSMDYVGVSMMERSQPKALDQK
jgi:hypothetical protein